MTDQSLLELAAKAAGYAIESYGDGWAWAYEIGSTPDQDGELPIFRFAPLTDDGDEARLESVLGLNVLWGARCVSVGRKHFGVFVERYHAHSGDKQAARRRAGVRAAAEIGKEMP